MRDLSFILKSKHMYQKLPPLKGNITYDILSLDMEHDRHNIPYIWVVAGTFRGKKIERTFNDPLKVIQFLFKRKWPNTVVTGMNLAYDLRTLIGKDKLEWRMVENMGKLIFLQPSPEDKIKLDRKAIKAIELSHFWPKQSLKDILMDTDKETGIKSYKPSYLEFLNRNNTGIHIDEHIIENSDYETMKQACISHCWGAVYGFEEIQKQINLLNNKIEITPAKTALTVHRRNFLDRKAQVLRKLPFEEALFQYNSYFGGRTEVFKRGIFHNTYYLDINSSYPYQMKINDFPDLGRPGNICYPPTEKSLIKYLNKYEGCAEVYIKTPDNLNIPLLPKKACDGKIMFMSGYIQGIYTFPEIRKALSLGYKIEKIGKVLYYPKLKVSLFGAYVDELYKLKGDPVYKQIAKLLLNSLYGKFAQRANLDHGWILVDENEEINIPDILENEQYWKYHTSTDSWYHYVPDEPIEVKGFAKHSLPLISSYITSYARIYIYEMYELVGFENVLYSDTDSVIITQEGYEKIKNSELLDDIEIGKWKIEHSNVDIEIRGLKYYRLREPGGKWKYKIKGVRYDNMSSHWMYKISNWESPRKTAGSIRSDDEFNKRIFQHRKDGIVEAKRVFKGRNSYPIESEF